jgi:hypothetical protein
MSRVDWLGQLRYRPDGSELLMVVIVGNVLLLVAVVL